MTFQWDTSLAMRTITFTEHRACLIAMMVLGHSLLNVNSYQAQTQQVYLSTNPSSRQSVSQKRLRQAYSVGGTTSPWTALASTRSRSKVTADRRISTVVPEFHDSVTVRTEASGRSSLSLSTNDTNATFIPKKNERHRGTVGLLTAAYRTEITSPVSMTVKDQDKTRLMQSVMTTSLHQTKKTSMSYIDFIKWINYQSDISCPGDNYDSFFLSTADMEDCLMNRQTLTFCASSGIIAVQNMSISPHLLTRRSGCMMKIKLPADRMHSVHFNYGSCNSAYTWTYKTNFNVLAWQNFCGKNKITNTTTYASASSTMHFSLSSRRVRGLSTLTPFSLHVNFSTLPPYYPILVAEYANPFNGSVSTPNWNLKTTYLFVMEVWHRLMIPVGRVVMISFFDIKMRFKSWSGCERFGSQLSLHAHPSSKAWIVYCGKAKPGPSAYTSDSGILYIMYYSNFKSRFKLQFSFHLHSDMLDELADGTWNCSVPQWSEFRHHFPCNHQDDCCGREDEAPCSYTTPGCGEGRLTIANRCYIYSDPETIKTAAGQLRHITGAGDVTWFTEERKCREKGGQLPGLVPVQEFDAVISFLRETRGYLSFYTGMVRSAFALSFIYRDIWADLDDTIAHYVGTVRVQTTVIPNSNRVFILGSYLLYTTANTIMERAKMSSLCEVPAISSSMHVKDIPRLRNKTWEQISFWWDKAYYWRCPDGHIVHTFLACDVQSSCWAASCPIPVTSMMCNNGVQHVPYTLVCDGRPDCDDLSDEDFCVFLHCDVLTQFKCTDKTCIPLDLMCNGMADCRDAIDELQCQDERRDIYTESRETFPPPPLVTFDGSGSSVLLSLNRTLCVNKTQVNGTLLISRLVSTTLTAETFLEGTFVNGTVVSGTLTSSILLSGTLINGTLISTTSGDGSLKTESLSKGTQVSGSLVNGSLFNATLVNGSHLVGGILVNGTLVSGTSLCPDTHFQCAEYDYCLPIFTRCNNLYDCPGHEDEADCDNYLCPGLYRCRGARICVHRRDICDGVFHCPQNDDELVCNLQCSDGCVCYGLAFFCSHAIIGAFPPQLRYLDASHSGIKAQSLQNNTMLVYLSLVRCDVADLGTHSLPNLRTLDLSFNNVTQITRQLLLQLPNLQNLILAHNPLTSLFVSKMASSWSFPSLRSLDVSGAFLPELDLFMLSVFPGLHSLNMTGCGVDRMAGTWFKKKLRKLDLRGCPMTYFPRDLFHGLEELTVVYADSYKLCCPAALPAGFSLTGCKAPYDEVSSCDALLRSDFLRICLTLFAVLSCVGNLSSLMFRVITGKHKRVSGFDIFVANLCLSDFLMGIYLVIIGLADRLYLGEYMWFELGWRHSVFCKWAGFLSLLSNEMSAFTICLITMDRFFVLRFPLSRIRFSKSTAFLASAITWALCIAIAAAPLLPAASHWRFYSQTGICIPLPTSRKNFEGQEYVFSVMILLNFALFVIVAVGQPLIYVSVQKNKMPSLDDTVSACKKDQTLARRLITVAMSDFLCWFPIGLLGIMTANGYQVPGEINVAIAVCVLPFNSTINPFLYTLNIVIEKRRLARERRLKQFFLSQMKARYTANDNTARVDNVYQSNDAQRLLQLWLKQGILSRERVLHFLDRNDVDTV